MDFEVCWRDSRGDVETIAECKTKEFALVIHRAINQTYCLERGRCWIVNKMERREKESLKPERMKIGLPDWGHGRCGGNRDEEDV